MGRYLNRRLGGFFVIHGVRLTPNVYLCNQYVPLESGLCAMEKISVVIPVYNAEKTLASCVRSVLSQTYPDFEVILVDDGSQDDSPAMCDACAMSDARVRCVHQPNRGPADARWNGVCHADGGWVTFVDSDDTLLPTALADLYAHAGDGTDIVLGNGESLPGERRPRIPIDEFRFLAVKGEGQIGLVWGSLYRRSSLMEYDFDMPPGIRMGEDYLFWLRLVFRTDSPVNVLYKNVYRKGADTCCSQFVWTADFAQRIHELRKGSIPAGVRALYMKEMISDRVANLFEVAVHCPRSEWQGSPFWQELVADMDEAGVRFPLKHRLFFALPGRRLRRAYSRLSDWRLKVSLFFVWRKRVSLSPFSPSAACS